MEQKHSINAYEEYMDITCIPMYTSSYIITDCYKLLM